jgi:hypothetical protein
MVFLRETHNLAERLDLVRSLIDLQLVFVDDDLKLLALVHTHCTTVDTARALEHGVVLVLESSVPVSFAVECRERVSLFLQ